MRKSFIQPVGGTLFVAAKLAGVSIARVSRELVRFFSSPSPCWP